jgi:hypothetical protein
VILYHLGNVSLVELGTGYLGEFIHDRFVLCIQVAWKGDAVLRSDSFQFLSSLPVISAIIAPKSLTSCRTAFSFATSPSRTSSIPP